MTHRRSRLARRVVWEGSIGSFGIDEVELPNGVRASLAMLHHPGAAAVVPFLDDERIVLLRQFRHAAGGEIWEVPAGKLEAGEDPAKCAARELEEETGYRAGRLVRCGEILTTPGFTDERIHLFCAHELERTAQALEPHELVEVREVSLARALAMIADGELTDAKSIACLHHAARLAALR